MRHASGLVLTGFVLLVLFAAGAVLLDHIGAAPRWGDAVTVMSLFSVFGLGFVGDGLIRAFRAARARRSELP